MTEHPLTLRLIHLNRASESTMSCFRLPPLLPLFIPTPYTSPFLTLKLTFAIPLCDVRFVCFPFNFSIKFPLSSVSSLFPTPFPPFYTLHSLPFSLSYLPFYPIPPPTMPLSLVPHPLPHHTSPPSLLPHTPLPSPQRLSHSRPHTTSASSLMGPLIALPHYL